MLEGGVQVMMQSVILIVLMAMAACTSAKHPPITQEELVRNTQEMFDSMAIGEQALRKKYFAEDCVSLTKREEA